MKKIVLITLTLALMTLAGCGGSGSSKPTSSTANSVTNVLEQQMNNNAPAVPEPEKPTEKPTAVPIGDVDVDLTAMSSTMVYSEVSNMIYEPDSYIGKTVRMGGQFTLFWGVDENGSADPSREYYACIIADATACCSQGLEFVLGGDCTYPDDYPELGAEIMVEGVFEVYEEDGLQYCHLVNAVMV